MSPRRWFRRSADPGAAWAHELLRPLRRRRADIDIAAGVMRRIAGRPPAPTPAPLPGAWPRVAWAFALCAGLAALALLVATAGAIVVTDDEATRAALALTTTAARVTLRGFDHMAGVLAALAGAALAILKGVWVVIDTFSPVVRGGVIAGAIAGLASIGISVVVVSRARLTAPVTERAGTSSINGGLA